MKTKLPLYLALLLLTQCSKCKTDDPAPVAPNPVDMLPPATQTGQRTFGCLLNGQPWNLAGNPFGGPLLATSYSSNRLAVVANRSSTNGFERISFVIRNLYASGAYPVTDSTRNFALYENFTTGCSTYTSSTPVGTVALTRLDLVNRIVSGTFSFTLEKPGCGRVVVTDGRFDSRF